VARTTRFRLLALQSFVLVLLIVGASNQAHSQTFKDHQARVSSSITALETLAQTDETESAEAYKTRIDETVRNVKDLLPENETVQWNTDTIEVDNKWLHQQLEKYQNSRDSEREEHLRSIVERLQAIDERLSEYEHAKESDKLTKDEANAKLAEILGRPEYARKNPEGSAFAKLWRRLMQWLQSLMPKQPQMSPGRANIITLIVQGLVVLVALGVIVYVIKAFAPQLFKQTRKKKKKERETRVVLGETLAPEQSASDLLSEAEALARRGELRAAIRKAYIALLVELGDRKILSLAQYKTNRDYLRAVRELEPLYRHMKGLTDSFENHWYGFVGVTEDDWLAFRAGYNKALAHRDSI
jgi:Domain of unknown function (DUF4129)